jgi:protein-L-isoaspartate(D-aspartate) O-methyltransferase
VIPIQSDKGQFMVRVTRTPDGYQQEHLETANFVPLMGGMI